MPLITIRINKRNYLDAENNLTLASLGFDAQIWFHQLPFVWSQYRVQLIDKISATKNIIQPEPFHKGPMLAR